MTIVSNQVKCNKCGDTPWSGHRHDFRRCKCGNIAVDGGDSYLRRVGSPTDCTEMSIEIEETDLVKMIEAVDWGYETGRNSRGIVYAVLRAMRDSGFNLKKIS